MSPASAEPPHIDYDQLSARAQAVVRAEWAAAIDARLADLDLVGAFAAQHRSYVELDDAGHVALRAPKSDRAPPSD